MKKILNTNANDVPVIKFKAKGKRIGIKYT